MLQASNIIASAKKEADAKRAVILEKAKKEAQEVKKRLKSVAELEARKRKLQAKQELVEEAFKKTLEKLNSLSDKEYEQIISQMLINSVESGSEEIILSPRDKKRLSPNFVEEINKKLVAKGIKGSLSLSKESRDINGGFVLKSGDIETNSSFEALIRAKREEIEPEVIKVMF